MARALRFATREQGLILEMQRSLIDVQSYEDIHQLTAGVLLPLCGADHFALGFASLDGSPGLQWVSLTAMALLKDYPLWALRDFVYRATMAKSNTVLSTSQMLRGKPLEEEETYQRSLAAGLRLRHALAALLVEPHQGNKGGIALYREGRRPFPNRAQRLVQEVTRDIKGAVSTVQRLYACRLEKDLLKAVSLEAGATLILMPHRSDIVRTNAVTPMVEKWFAPHELHLGVPREWMEKANQLSAQEGTPDPVSTRCTRNKDGVELRATFIRFPVRWSGRPLWEVRVVERPHWLRADWFAVFTRRERQVADLLNEGLVNKEIASKLGIAPGTVKKHVDAIFLKTDTHSRGEFVAKGRRS